MLQPHLALDAIQAADPARIFADVGLEIQDWQRRALMSTSLDLMILAGRQTGKSTVGALKILHTMLHRPESMVVMVGKVERQAHELLFKVRDYCRKLSYAPPAPIDSAQELRLQNGSRALALPGDPESVRSISGVDLLLIDESQIVDEELLVSVMPMLAVRNGTCWKLGSAYGKRGWFYHEWRLAKGCERIKITSEESPIIPKEFLERERERLEDRPWEFAQEYCCEFTSTEHGLFNEAFIASLFSDQRKAIW